MKSHYLRCDTACEIQWQIVKSKLSRKQRKLSFAFTIERDGEELISKFSERVKSYFQPSAFISIFFRLYWTLLSLLCKVQVGKISTCNRSAETLFCREDEKVLNEHVFYSKGKLPWDAIYSIRKEIRRTQGCSANFWFLGQW